MVGVRYGICGTKKYLVFKLQPGTSNGSSYAQVYVTFLLSGFVHWAIMVLRWKDGWSLPFFILQATAIMLENGVITGALRLGIGKGEACTISGLYMGRSVVLHQAADMGESNE